MASVNVKNTCTDPLYLNPCFSSAPLWLLFSSPSPSSCAACAMVVYCGFWWETDTAPACLSNTRCHKCKCSEKCEPSYFRALKRECRLYVQMLGLFVAFLLILVYNVLQFVFSLRSNVSVSGGSRSSSFLLRFIKHFSLVSFSITCNTMYQSRMFYQIKLQATNWEKVFSLREECSFSFSTRLSWLLWDDTQKKLSSPHL